MPATDGLLAGRWPVAILITLGCAVGIALVVGGATTAVAFSSFNPDWDGTSDLRTLASDAGSDAVVIRNTSQYSGHGQGDVAFVIAPTDSYSPAAADAVTAYVERGGTLVVAARDGDAAPALLEAVGADARPIGPTLRDERTYHRSPALPEASNVTDHALVANVSMVTLNYGTAIKPGNATVLIRSSEFSYLDRDDNQSPSENETLQAHPVVTTEPVGQGQVVLISDPSVFINVMQDETGNEAFAAALVADAETTLVDVSHVAALPPIVAVLLAIRDSVALQLGVGVGAVAAVWAGTRIFRAREQDSDPLAPVDEATVTEGASELFPGVDSERIEKITEGIISHRDENSDDE